MGDTELGRTSGYLRKTIVSIANPQRCIDVLKGYLPTCHKSVVHIYVIGDNTETRVGDSGSPLLANDGGDKTVLGLVRCGLMDATEFTRVSYYSDWILNNINN